jgi:hypothetical protein
MRKKMKNLLGLTILILAVSTSCIKGGKEKVNVYQNNQVQGADTLIIVPYASDYSEHEAVILDEGNRVQITHRDAKLSIKARRGSEHFMLFEADGVSDMEYPSYLTETSSLSQLTVHGGDTELFFRWRGKRVRLILYDFSIHREELVKFLLSDE